MGLTSVFRDQPALAPEDATPRRRFEGSDLAAGAELGLRGAESGYYNLPVVGDPNAAAYAEAHAAGVPVQFRSSEDVDFLNPSQVIDYAQQNIGQLGVSTLPTLVGGGLGAGLARTIMGRAAVGLTEAEMARRAATIGNAARGGAVAAGTGQAYGDMAAELRSQGLEPGAATGLLALGSGIGNVFGLENAFKSLVASAGEDAVQAATRSRLASVAIGAGQGALKTGGIETATEVGDEALAIANRAYYDPAYREKTDDMWGRVKETAIATMAGTGLMGGAAGTVGGLRSPTPGAPNENTQLPPAANSAATDTAQTSASVPPVEGVLPSEPRSLLERVGGEPAPTHDMTLEELRAMDSSTSPGETYGESQNATKEVPVQTDATGQRQEVLKPAGASAPAPTWSQDDRDHSSELTPFLQHGKDTKHVQGMNHIFQSRLSAMLRDAPKGAQIMSGYRSPERQQELWDAALAKYGSPEAARKWVAPPGHSNHNHGIAGDLTFASDEAKQWVHKNAAKYGLRFRMAHEGWHIEPIDAKGDDGDWANRVSGGTEAPATDQQFLGRQDLPRGIRNNNPGNIDRREGINWDGTIDGPEERFVTFATPEHGIRAAAKNIMAKAGRGVDTLRGLIYIYAPPNENDTEAYVRKVASATGIDPEQKIDLRSQTVLEKLVPAIIQHENGMNPYSPEQLSAGITSAVTGKPVRALGQKVRYTKNEVGAEASELARRKTAGEPTYQETDLGRAYKTGMLEPDPEKSGQIDSDDPFSLTGTSEGFELTFKGRKYDSTGDDLMKPARPLAEPEADTFEGMAQDSTPVRAFSEVMYPGAKVEVVGEKGNINRKVSVVFPEDQRDAIGENQKGAAGEVLKAFVSGAKADQKEKILLEHPDVVSSKSDNPIEIPLTKEGLARIGRALDPGAYDSAPSASHAAAMSGLTHLIYDKGFVPRGVDVSKVKEVQKWIGEKLGTAQKTISRGDVSDRPTATIDPSLPVRKIISGGQTGVDRAGLEAGKELGIDTGGMAPKGYRTDVGPDESLKKFGVVEHPTNEGYPARTMRNVMAADGTVVFKVPGISSPGSDRTIEFAESGVWGSIPGFKPREGRWRGKVLVLNPNANAQENSEVIRKFVADNNIQTLNVAGHREKSVPGINNKVKRLLTYALRPDTAPVAPASRSTPIAFASTDTDAGGRLANLTAPVEPRPGSQQFVQDENVSGAIGQTPVQRTQQYDRVIPAAIPVRAGQQADLGFSSQGFDEGAYVAPLTELADGTDPAAEAGPYEAANRLDRVVNRAVTEDKDITSVGARKGETRRSTENTTNKVEDTAKRTRELNSKSIETVHKVSGGATIRATGVSDKTVQFLSNALKDIGLEVPLRVMGKAGIAQHLDALQQRIDGLVEAIMREEEALKRMPGVLKAEKEERKQQQKKIQTLRRALQDASAEQERLLDAQEQAFAARVIYNDHYQDATRRTPTIVISDEAANSPNLTKVLGHELGHVVQRAWFDQLPIDLKTEIMMELSDDFRHLEDWPERFADLFVSWYELNKQTSTPYGSLQDAVSSAEHDVAKHADRVKTSRDLAGVSNPVKHRGVFAKSGKALHDRMVRIHAAFEKLAKSLRDLWNNLVKQDKKFRDTYPKFDEFLRSTVGKHGRMKPINPQINKLWTESLAQPYGGLPLAAADKTKFNDMSPEDYAAKVAEGIQAAKDRAAKYAENKAGENVIAQRYLRKTAETYDAFKKMAAIALVADGTWLRNAGNGILRGYADIVAPIKGRELKNMQVIKPTKLKSGAVVGTNEMNGSIQSLTDHQYGTWRTKLDPILEKVSKLTPAEYKDLIENLRDETMRTKTPLAQSIRTYYAQMLHFMRRNDVKVGARSGYYTKAWDLEKFIDSEEAVIADFEKVFAAREELPVDPRVKLRPDQEPVKFSTPRAAAVYEFRRITEGRVDNVFEQLDEETDPELRGPAFRYARKRMFSDEEYTKFGLNKWLNDDIAWTMNTYTQLGVKRAVQQMATGIPKAQRRNLVTRKYWENRFIKAKLLPELIGSPVASLELLLAEGVQDGRLSEEEYLEARKRVMSVMGMTNIGSNPRARRWVNRILAYETLLTMGWSAFAQLADFGISAWRADSFDRVSKTMGQIIDKQTRAQQKELLRTIGLSLDELTRHALNSGMMSADPMAKGPQWWTEKFFRLNQMHRLSEANLLFSSMLGQSYLKDYADKAVNGETQEVRDDAMKRIRQLHPNITPAEILTKDFSNYAPLQIALHEYVSQSHLHNQIGYTPRIFSDYRFAVFTQLKGFMFKYHNIVLRQMWERMKDKPDLLHAAMPLVALAVPTMALAFIGMELKESLRRRLLPKVKRYKEKTGMQKFHDAVMASGIPGAYIGLFDNMLEAPQHGQPGLVALAGPTIGHAFNISARTADEWLPSSVPIVASVPWFRSSMRQGLRDTFGFGVRDEEE
jgi:LAS superfamily LD-carboxypeptidase LdcB